jgi:glycosyltransferase involved in cell wall biosynthesis
LKKVLIITTHFPPDRHVGGRRPTKFAKFLPQFGWQSVILTIPICELEEGMDNSFLEDLPEGLKVYRIMGWTKSAGIKGVASKKEAKLFLKIRSRIGGLLFPHFRVNWILKSIMEGIKIVKNDKIDIILSTVPDPEAFVAASFLSVFTDRKFVCDFRDSTTLTLDRRFPLEFIMMKFFQKVAQWKANAIVSTSKVLRQHLIKEGWPSNKKKYVTIYNGFDIKDFNSVQQRYDKTAFTITFVGSWGLQRDPKYFLAAIENLLLNNLELLGKIKVVFVGWVKRDISMERWLEERLSKGILKMVVESKGFLPYRKALSEMQQADVLLACNSDKVVRSGALESKIFEYLYTGKPVLALGGKDCDLDYLLKDMKAGIVVESDKPELISNAILNLFQKYSKGSLQGASYDDIKQFERKQLTKRLAELFDAVMIGKRNLVSIGWE